MTETTLNGLSKLAAYRERRTHIFQSPSSLEWYVRGHRRALINAGALVLIAGHWHADNARFDAFVLQVGEQAAKRQVAAA